MKTWILCLFVSIPFLVRGQDTTQDVNQIRINLYDSSAVYLTTHIWSGILVSQNGNTTTLEKFAEANFSKYPTVYQQYQSYKKNRRNALIALFPVEIIGLAPIVAEITGNHSRAEKHYLLGASILALFGGGTIVNYFQSKADEALNRAIWEYNRQVVFKN